MSATAVKTLNKGSITLQGSAAMIREFFHYGINNILFQRGIYPSDSFIREKRFGMTLLISSDNRVSRFLDPFLSALESYLSQKVLRRMVVAIADTQTTEVLERWVFEIEEEDDEDELEKLRKLRLGQIKASTRGRVMEIANKDEFLRILDSSAADDLVLIHIYRDGSEECDALNEVLLAMSARTNTVQYFKVKATTLKTSDMFEANALPALQSYIGGELASSMIRVHSEFAEGYTADDICAYLDRVGITIRLAEV